LAAVNTPTQFVLSGHAHALDAAVAILRKDRESSQAIINVRRVLPLNVSAPFHCSLMAPAAAALTTAVSEMASPLRDVQHAPLISGFGAAAVSTAADIQGALVSGIEAPVRWAQAVSAALSFVTDGVADGDAPPHFLELGPGSTLGAFVKALEPNACISSVGTVEQVRAFGSK
jgi:[acyl-carrier-protein] S-malonyltransferase